MASLKGILTLAGGMILLALVLAISTVLGAVSVALTPLLLMGMLHLLGYVALGLVEAVVLWFAVLGGLLGLLRGLGFAAALGGA